MCTCRCSLYVTWWMELACCMGTLVELELELELKNLVGLLRVE